MSDDERQDNSTDASEQQSEEQPVENDQTVASETADDTVAFAGGDTSRG